MDELAPPSFSLGLDFDLDSEPQIPIPKPISSTAAIKPSSQSNLLEEDDDFDTPTTSKDLKDQDPPRSLKRLRRGPTVTPSAAKKKLPETSFGFDDDIEEFSSQEDIRTDGPPSTLHSVCGSSKFRLHGHGIFTTQSSRKKENALHAPAAANVETCSKEKTFPKLTTSPLRRFQLIDSDSCSDFDDPYLSEGANKNANKSVSSLKRGRSNPPNHVSVNDEGKTNASARVSQTEDLWENFFPAKNVHIQTPALDEVCEEYFGSMKNKNLLQSNSKICNESSNVSRTMDQKIDMGDSLPPSHRYFFHDDPRIQLLVRSHLPNFFPLCAVSNSNNIQPRTSDIDYMGQFNQGEGSKQTSKKSKGVTSSSRSKTKSKTSNTDEASLGWVNPKSGVARGNTKDVGKRRVQADGQSGGRWFTGPNGKRVYVKNGQELTGQMAYRQFKKDNGGFKGSKRKKAAKKKK